MPEEITQDVVPAADATPAQPQQATALTADDHRREDQVVTSRPVSATASPEGPAASTGDVAAVEPVPTIAPASGVREQLAAMGFDASRFSSDDEALRQLAGWAGQINEYQQLAQYGQRYLQNAEQFEQYMAGGEDDLTGDLEGLDDGSEPWFEPPDWRPEWSQYVKENDQGMLVPVDGADPAYAARAQAYYTYIKDWQQQFWSDPEGMIAPLVEAYVEDRVNQMLSQQFTQYNEQVRAQQFVDQNKEWMFAQDQTGQYYVNPQTGKPFLSQDGQGFLQGVQQAEALGITNGAAQNQYALQQLAAQKALASQQAPSAPVTTAVSRQPTVQPNQGGALSQTLGGNVPVGAPSNGGPPRSLKERMMSEFSQSGYAPNQIV